jgi:hypothetical protein
LYDISKALLILKSIDIIHNDCLLDNIGIFDGNFVIFDFDGSGSPREKIKDFDYDFNTLKKSFEFHGFKLPFKYTGIFSVIQYVSTRDLISFSESFDYLENLVIENSYKINIAN